MVHHGNATPHTSLIIRQKLIGLNRELMPHPPLSLGFAQSKQSLPFGLLPSEPFEC